jgi:hypothetical protein
MSYAIVHPLAIQPLRSELLSTTALTPTHHKGGGFFKIAIAIVAAIVIPYAAPAIAGAIGLTSAIGAVAGGALVGGALGAGVAFATGGNPWVGAIGGAIGGGIGGAMQVAPTPGAGIIEGGGLTIDSAGNFIDSAGLAIPSSGSAGSAGLVSTPTGTAVGAGGVVNGGTVPTLATSGGAGYGNALSGTPFTVNAGGSAGLSAPVTSAYGAGAPLSLNPAFSVVNSASGAAVPIGGVGPGATAPLLASRVAPTALSTNAAGAPSVQNAFTGPPGNFSASVPNSVAGPAPTASQISAFQPPKEFGEKVANFFDSEGIKLAGGQAVTKLASGFLAKEPEQTELEKQQLAKLNEARAQEAELLQERRDKSDEFVRQAENINPDFFGASALADEQNRLSRAQQAGLRGINARDTGSRQATTRRNALDRSRLGAFNKGRADAESRRLQLVGQAVSTAPKGSRTAAGLAGDLRASDAAFARVQKERQEIADIGGSIFQGTQEDSDADRLRRRNAARNAAG